MYEEDIWLAGKKMAERVGFEPTARCRVTGFQDQLLKPLGHLSEFRLNKISYFPRFVNIEFIGISDQLQIMLIGCFQICRSDGVERLLDRANDAKAEQPGGAALKSQTKPTKIGQYCGIAEKAHGDQRVDFLRE